MRKKKNINCDTLFQSYLDGILPFESLLDSAESNEGGDLTFIPRATPNLTVVGFEEAVEDIFPDQRPSVVVIHLPPDYDFHSFSLTQRTS